MALPVLSTDLDGHPIDLEHVAVRRVQMFRDDETPSAVLAEVRLMVVEAFDGQFADDDWDHTVGGWRVVVFDGQSPLSHAAVVLRALRVGRREFRTGYVEGVATRKERQHQGLGSMVMTQVTKLVRSGFELGALSTGRQDFYRGFGWESWRGPSYVQEESQLIRTLDEDDGLMVLRCGPSAAVDLGAPITCRSRRGDDW